MSSIQLIFTPKALFPHFSAPDRNERCVVVTRLVEALAVAAQDQFTQAQWQTVAMMRYHCLIVDQLSSAEAHHDASLLQRRGVPVAVTRAYYELMFNRDNS